MADIPVPSPKAKMFLLTTPNSPYGVGFPTAWVARLLDRFKGIVVADEAYVDFAGESCLPLLASHPRLVIARTLSKAYSLAGMRAGLAFAHEELIREMMKVKDSYNVSRLAQVAACAALEDQEYFRTIRDRIIATRERFSNTLASRGFTVLPSQANFVFAVPPRGLAAGTLYEGLLSRGFLVRHWKTGIVSDGLRISIGTDGEMDALVRATEEVIRGRSVGRSHRAWRTPPGSGGCSRRETSLRAQHGADKVCDLSLGNPDVEPPGGVPEGARGGRCRPGAEEARLHAECRLP